VDEAGKLELDKKGFYPALAKLIPHYMDARTTGTLLLVIREGLCHELCQFLAITGVPVVDSLKRTGC